MLDLIARNTTEILVASRAAVGATVLAVMFAFQVGVCLAAHRMVARRRRRCFSRNREATTLETDTVPIPRTAATNTLSISARFMTKGVLCGTGNNAHQYALISAMIRERAGSSRASFQG